MPGIMNTCGTMMVVEGPGGGGIDVDGEKDKIEEEEVKEEKK